MTNNDILRRLRYALNLDDVEVLRLFRLGGCSLRGTDLDPLLQKEGEPGFAPCPDRLLRGFLDGLISSRRGARKSAPDDLDVLNNNLILRKIRIALKFKDADMIRILDAGGMTVSKSELSALFRNPEHRNFVLCGDQLLRNFLSGLAAISREDLYD
ncbi:MAG: DUF1456 family protein [Desulfovibrionales bacterium]